MLQYLEELLDFIEKYRDYDRVIEYIKKKEDKIAEYRKKKLSAYWLFLTVPDRTFCGIDDLKMTQEVVSDYERIYICDSRHVFQVK